MDDNEKLFRFWIEQGWKYRRRYNERMTLAVTAPEYKKRLKYEYETICAREGFVDYFLIVSDLVRHAKDTGIVVGPGRGSAAASLVCYLLRITEIDPLCYPMLFERFLDPTRSDPPDIDIDFDDERRDEVFEYAATKYGVEKVANIGTFTRYQGRSSLDDIARVYHIPAWKINTYKSMLIDRSAGHPRFSKTLEDTRLMFPEIQQLVDETPELLLAENLEGNIKTFGVHAAAIVISDNALDELSATYEREIGDRVGRTIAYDKYDAAEIGLLKIDILSLSTLGMIAKALELAGLSLEHLYRLPLDDKETMEAFGRGDVLGVFQFEGNTTRRILKAVAPTEFMHLSDVNALSRPGADDKQYVSNKRVESWPDSIHSIIDDHLNWTYGVIVYEEQILMILRDLGGFEPAQLNGIRKVIHYKLGSTEFNKFYQQFVNGCARYGLSETDAASVWDGMVSASGYAFNIAHSVAYATIGYWAQWLKIHYPAEFYAAQLIKCPDDKDGKIRKGKLIQEAERHNIIVSPPRLLESGHNWTLSRSSGNEKPTILAGFEAIPGIGPATAAAIIDWRLTESSAYGVDDFFPEWDDLSEIRNIGPKTIATLKDFCEGLDPFGVNEVKRVLNSVRDVYETGQLAGVPVPTHVSIDLPIDGSVVCFMGIARKRKYYDAVEQAKKKATGELSTEDALEQIDDPHLLKYVALDLEDEYGQLIKVWVNRWNYPQLGGKVENIKLNRDVVVVQGKSSDFGGISIRAKQMEVIDPYG
jgi:Zierdtviridae DNA polymerase